MKKTVAFLLTTTMLSILAGCGCSASITTNNNSQQESTMHTTQEMNTTEPATKMTKEEAESIALKHANLTAEEVSYLHTEYEIDYGIPQYDVHFRKDTLEYDYEIHAETGEILSFEQD